MKMKNVVQISAERYTAILELALKAAVLKDAIFSEASLNYDGKSLICVTRGDADTLAKYLFPEEYAAKLAELTKKDGE